TAAALRTVGSLVASRLPRSTEAPAMASRPTTAQPPRIAAVARRRLGAGLGPVSAQVVVVCPPMLGVSLDFGAARCEALFGNTEAGRPPVEPVTRSTRSTMYRERRGANGRSARASSPTFG